MPGLTGSRCRWAYRTWFVFLVFSRRTSLAERGGVHCEPDASVLSPSYREVAGPRTAHSSHKAFWLSRRRCTTGRTREAYACSVGSGRRAAATYFFLLVAPGIIASAHMAVFLAATRRLRFDEHYYWTIPHAQWASCATATPLDILADGQERRRKRTKRYGQHHISQIDPYERRFFTLVTL